LEDILELDDQELGIEDGTSQGEPDSIANPAQSRQPAKVNLDEFKEFRKFKSETQKRDYQKEQAILAERNQRQQLEMRLRAIEMEGLDDVGRIAYENKLLKQQLYEREQEDNRRYAEWQWTSLIDEVARETGIPKEDLEDAKDSNDLWRMGRKYERENGAPRTTNNRVALGGGGKASSTEASIRNEYRKAREDNNYSGMNAAKEKAFKAGIDPDSLRR
jgi:hypothetical protein